MAVGQRKYYHAVISGGAGDITVVTAVANHRIAVHGYVICSDNLAEGSVRWESEAAGTALTGVMPLGMFAQKMNGIIVCPFSEVPWFITDAEALATDDDLSLEATGTGAYGHVIYSLIPIR